MGKEIYLDGNAKRVFENTNSQLAVEKFKEKLAVEFSRFLKSIFIPKMKDLGFSAVTLYICGAGGWYNDETQYEFSLINIDGFRNDMKTLYTIDSDFHYMETITQHDELRNLAELVEEYKDIFQTVIGTCSKTIRITETSVELQEGIYQ